MFKQLAYFSITIAAIITLMVVAQPALVPLAFGLLLALMLYWPMRYMEHRGMPRMVAILLLYLLIAVVTGALIWGFSAQISHIADNGSGGIAEQMGAFYQKIKEQFSQWGISLPKKDDLLGDNVPSLLTGPMRFIGGGLVATTSAAISFILTVVSTFLLLLYSQAFKHFLVTQTPKDKREVMAKVLRISQRMSMRYLLGLMAVMAILATLNTLGLWAIGVRYSLFWGSLAAILTIVPYIGTATGAMLPALFVLIDSGTFWQPLAVLGVFIVIQQLEDNLIKPKIVGDQVDVNPLVAIFAVVAGGLIWGIPGLILALPYIAMIRIVFEQIDPLKPLAKLMGSHVLENAEDFDDNYDKKQYRLIEYFFNDKNERA